MLERLKVTGDHGESWAIIHICGRMIPNVHFRLDSLFIPFLIT